MFKSRKISCLFMAVLFLTITIGFGGISKADAAVNLTDVSGHWAQSQINNLVEQGVITGNPDGTFMPDKSVTRAEFIVMINRAFSFTKTTTINYPDVNSSDWFAPEIAKAVAAGYSVGSDGMMNPNAFITRAEAATMLARAAKLDTAVSADSLAKFNDGATIPAWSQNFVAAVVKAGYMNGFPDGTFKASDTTTKAMAAVMLNKSIGVVYGEAGTFGPQTGTATIDGNVIISAAGVVLQNTIINGNLLIAEKVGEGDVTLKNVTVVGTTTINGGGAHSINADGSTFGRIISNKRSVHIVCENGTTVVSLTLANGASVDVAAGSTIAGVTVSTTGEVILHGSFASVTIAGANENVTLTGGTITSLTVDATATGAVVNIAQGAKVTTFTANAAASVTGTGTITTATINASGVTTTIKPGTTNTATGVTPPTTPSIGGGGGGSATVTVTAINVELTGLGTLQTVASNGVTFNLSDYADTVAATQMEITTTPSAAITNATLTISQIRTRGMDFLSTPITITTTDGSVTVGQLLGALAANDDVSLGALRTIFGSEDIVITGTLSKTGYIFNSGNDMTITIKLGAGGGNVVINNAYVKIEDTGVGTATVTINDPTATVGALKGSGFNFASVIVSVVTGSEYTEGANTAAFKAAVETFVNGGVFDSLTLGQLIGKTVTFNGYTVSFVAAEPVTSITVTGAGDATTISTNGGTLQMSAAVSPVDAADKAVIWSVIPATGIATISTSGLLTATWNGTVTVKATAHDGSGVSGSKDITITGQVADKTALTNAIAAAQSKYNAAEEGTNPGQYAVGSKATLQTAITTATDVKNNESATPSEVSAAVTALNDAVSTFEASKVGAVDKAALTNAIAAAQSKYNAAEEGTNPGQYAVGSKATLQTAITTATAVKNNASATAIEVSAAVTDLNNAVNTFEAGKVLPVVEFAFSTLGTTPLLVPGVGNTSVTMQIANLANAATQFGVTESEFLNGTVQLAVNCDGQERVFAVVDVLDDGTVMLLEAAWTSTTISTEAAANALMVYKK